MTADRSTPTAPYTGNQFELPVRAVRTALDTIEALGPNATADEIFRAGRRLSAATGFLARELTQADQAVRLRQGISVPPVDDAKVVHEEAVKLEVAATDPEATPAEGTPPENVS